MAYQNQLVTIFGGTGFLGRYICRELAQAGYQINIVSRSVERAKRCKPAGSVGQVHGTSGSIHSDEDVANAVKHADIVINLCGILYESGKQTFDAVHHRAAERIAKACTKAGVQTFIHISALGVDHAPQSAYARSKAAGEKAVLKAFPNAVILRPGIVFGAEDAFFNRFASLGRFLPLMPLIGGGKTKFQPVYVGDVADAVLAAITQPKARGNLYELGGSEVLTFKEILDFIAQCTKRKFHYFTLPFWAARLQGAALGLLPKPPLTRDQVRLLETDNVVQPKAKTLATLGIKPTSIERIVPNYLTRYAKR